MEKFASEAWLTIVVAGSMSFVLIPLAVLLNWNIPRIPVRGVPERWQTAQVCSLTTILIWFLPVTMLNLLNILGIFRFMDTSAPVETLFKPTFATEPPDVWNKLTSTLKGSYASLLSVPVVISIVWVLMHKTRLIPTRPDLTLNSWRHTLASIIFCWAIFGLSSIGINMLLQFFDMKLGWMPILHPIAQIGIHDGAGGWIIGLGACLAAPLFEELIFRRWLLSWAIRRWTRPLLLQCFTVFAAIVGFCVVRRAEVLVFAAFLLVVQFAIHGMKDVIRRRLRLVGSRTFTTNWATSSLFAMMHASVWPSPIPLMVLSMGLGFVVVRTGRWWTAFLCHALFNFTSLMVLYASQGAFGPMFKIAIS